MDEGTDSREAAPDSSHSRLGAEPGHELWQALPRLLLCPLGEGVAAQVGVASRVSWYGHRQQRAFP